MVGFFHKGGRHGPRICFGSGSTNSNHHPDCFSCARVKMQRSVSESNVATPIEFPSRRCIGDRLSQAPSLPRRLRSTLVLLGSGLGLTMVSPWADKSASVTTIAASTAVWLIVVQWLSSGVGGYLAGRLRTKWVGVHTDEVFFRDTAHGFSALGACDAARRGMLASALSAALGTGVQAASTVASARGAVANQARRRPARRHPTSWTRSSDRRPGKAGRSRKRRRSRGNGRGVPDLIAGATSGEMRPRIEPIWRNSSRRERVSRKPMRRPVSMRF